ncbi:L7Ae/L30e/S12e/Gadd45 family ribosomal protein [Lactobacillus psittaci]|uniref:Ribosomal protein eL8/eL30/eS12/Gadd45 domain-containing protein n=1 Tax=Lactobacillus psittaci DSM 15354 TaxID=1122152 RepID=A0A0R1S552_9LACO|nr:ribosomal L7Ae/L30e/S12e/Gadd45 family protein [Lactobacillus psittaci]KRL64028.1 hypothetical protein FC23_GL000276 [Lactobacillus psittaci DSM 15354]
MQNKQKILNFLGLIQKAGKLISGTDFVLQALKDHKIKVLILASDLAPATREDLVKLAEAVNVPVIEKYNALELSTAIGRSRKVLGVSDNGFSKALLKKIN